jgi:hypothetical protein
MAVPTLPSMWSDVLLQLNAFLNWDIVKGFMVISVGLFLGSLAMKRIGRTM